MFLQRIPSLFLHKKKPMPPGIFFFCALFSYGLSLLPQHPPLFSAQIGQVIFTISLGLSAILGLGGIWTFHKRKTTIFPYETASRLVDTGLYRYIRNPMYTGLFILLTGEACLFGQLPPFIAPLMFIFLMNRLILDAEEEKLKDLFGADYESYLARTGRWLPPCCRKE